MSDPAAQLEADYCPPIDPALLSAIISDYDLHDTDALQEAKTTLDSIKASALEEEITDFDPSGTASHSLDPSGHASSQAGSETDLSRISNGRTSLNLSDRTGADSDSEVASDLHTAGLDDLDESTKIALLMEVFPSLGDHHISYTLKKCNHNWAQALDDLLNQVYFSDSTQHSDSEMISAKSIDAFSEDNLARRGRKSKRKTKAFKSLDDDRRLPSPVEAPTPTVNKWQTATKDIEFVASRIQIAPSTVSPVYHSHGASVSDTIAYFVKENLKTDTQTTSRDSTIQAQALELGYDFPAVSPEYLTALIRMCHPSTANAHELAKALSAKRALSGHGSLEVIPRYATPNLSDDELDSTARRSKPSSTRPSRSPSLDLAAASSMAHTYSVARHAALAQAQAAYRRSRSDHLMGAAAGYYSQLGREHASASQRYTSAAADALVDSQSSALQLDLHGVSVNDAIRISRSRAERWWDGLGESRVNGRVGAEDRARGFAIVTGVGRHSEGGKGKLGPAVSKALTAEGWRIEGGSGVIYVKGKVKR